MANKDGRPPVENPKQSVLGVRVTIQDHERIKKYAAEHHKTISQVVLDGLELLYNKEETKQQVIWKNFFPFLERRERDGKSKSQTEEG